MEHDARLSGDLGNIVKRLQNTRFIICCHYRYQTSRPFSLWHSHDMLTQIITINLSIWQNLNKAHIGMRGTHRVMLCLCCNDMAVLAKNNVICLSAPTGKNNITGPASSASRASSTCNLAARPNACTEDGFAGGPIAFCMAMIAASRNGVVALLSK